MAYLPEDCGEVARDVAPEPRREAVPDLAGLDRHDAKASRATVSRSRTASTLNFEGSRDRSGCGSRSVADRVSVRTQPDPWTTRTLAAERAKSTGAARRHL
jgi:hypothetical protein